MRRLLGGIAALALAAIPFTAAIDQAGATTSQCAKGVTVNAGASPATVNVNDTSTSAPVSVVVTITGTTFTVATADPTLALTAASWCVKSSTNTNSGTGTSGASTSTNKKGVVQDIGSVVLTNVTTRPGCYRTRIGELLDFRIFGPIDTLENANLIDSIDGTCNGDEDGARVTVVSAANVDEMVAKCTIIGGAAGLDAFPPGASGPLGLIVGPALNGYWLCGYPGTP